MKKTLIYFTLIFALLTFSGCNQSNHSTEETTNTTTFQADTSDITNSTYTLKVRKNMDLANAEIKFKDDTMEWTRTYAESETDTANASPEKIVLTDVKITTENEEYTIVGKKDDSTQTFHFRKIGNFRIEDEEGNIYTL
ncbi:hypothetical protein [Enterococcus mundtii]|uniref:Lipoprotein n=1 Tax=Enterococcus mundtii TaxID=53346 RepID=A0A2S7RW13_ENTMU|nr:hypothetical protein [Enterococcus mundtii]PQF24105.1 hypothetical protein CUS89_04990 [Enterococcus mundtii]